MNKSDKLFEILNNGKPVFKKENGMIKSHNPFDFIITENETDKTITFKNIKEAVDIISEFAGKENSEKIKQQLLRSSNNISEIDNSFILEFKVIE